MDFDFDEDTFSEFSSDNESEEKSSFNYKEFFNKYKKYFFAIIGVLIVFTIVYFIFFANRVKVTFIVQNFASKENFSEIKLFKNSKLYDIYKAGKEYKIKKGNYSVSIDLPGDLFIAPESKIVDISNDSTVIIKVYDSSLKGIKSISYDKNKAAYKSANFTLDLNILYEGAENTFIIKGTEDFEDFEESINLKKGLNSIKLKLKMPDKDSANGRLYFKGADSSSKYSISLNFKLKDLPNLEIINISKIDSISAGSSANLEITLKNNSSDKIKDLSFELDSLDSEIVEKDVFLNYLEFPDKFDIDASQQVSKIIKIKLPISMQKGKINFSLRLYNDYLEIIINNSIDVKEPDVNIEAVSDIGEIKAGDSKDIEIRIKNNTSATLEANISAELDLSNNIDYSSWVSLDKSFVNIEAGKEDMVILSFMPAITAKNDSGKIIFRLNNNYIDKSKEIYFSIKEINFDISIDMPSELSGEVISNSNIGKKKSEVITVNNNGDLAFTFANIYVTGDTACNKVKVDAGMEKTIEANDSKDIFLIISPNIAESSYNCFLNIDYINPLTKSLDKKEKAFILSYT